MAVEAGYSKIATSGSVFIYDTGDTINSYVGEPTTNLVGSPFSVTSGYATTLSTTDNVTLNWNGQNTGGLISGNGYFAYVSAATTNGNKYTTSWYIKGGTTNSINFVWGGAHQGNRTDFNFNTSTGAITGVSLASGEVYGASYLNNGWWQVYYSSTLSSGNNYYPQITLNGTAYVGGLQIEQKSHPTPFVVGTRSNTQGLLDISGGGSTLTLNNTYDSSAMVYFDGTDDTISIPSNSSNSVTGNITMEYIVKRNSGTQGVPMHKEVQYTMYLYSDGSVTYADSSLWSYASFGAHGTAVTPNVYHHVVATKSGSLVTIYVDGNVIVSKNFGGAITNTFNNLYIGSYDGTNAFFSGYIPVSKIYNRALSDGEVLSNFNHYKTRFNIT
ncbi:MAG: LamG domain-containing protein [Actinobacteria bacterium]|nr:LamG domain-containing protein [Actinomycetota bacterium]